MQVFGKLAKGLESAGVSRQKTTASVLLGAATLGAGENASVLEQLMHRVKETSSLEEKRMALNDIKELLQSHSEVSFSIPARSLDRICPSDQGRFWITGWHLSNGRDFGRKRRP